MKALITHAPYKMSFEEVPEPIMGPEEVKVRTRAVTLCGSDIHLYTGHHPCADYKNSSASS